MKRHHLKDCHPYLHFKSDGQCVYEMVLLFTLNTLDSLFVPFEKYVLYLLSFYGFFVTHLSGFNS